MSLFSKKTVPVEYPEIEITLEDVREIVYFILMKFKTDTVMGGTSAKRRMLGGFIEDWFNKSAETIVFNNLLSKKQYTVVPDYFLYDSQSDRNAPDLLGIKTKDKVIPFVQYDNGTWVTNDGMPRIEVKVFKKDQNLVAVRETQMIDDYYAFIESDLSNDFLAKLFSEEVFDEKYFNNLQMVEDFILNDEENKLIPHKKYEAPERIGSYKLLGIYTKEDLLGGTVLCGEKVSPYYYKDSEVATVSPKVEELVTIKENLFTYTYDDIIYLPIHITGVSKIKIVKKHKTTLYFEATEEVTINGKVLPAGIIKISYQKFERNSSWAENLCTKNMLPLIVKDSTNDLIKEFDSISRV